MKSFEHLIITRFNLNLYARDKHDAPTRTERWLAHRFAYRRRIGGYQSVCPQFRAVFYSAGQAGRLTESLRTTISDLLAGREGHVTPPLRSC